MQTKLTLRIDESIIRKAKRYSKKSQKSISKMVSDYLSLISEEEKSVETELTPRVQSLFGALAKSRISEKDYLDYVEKKHK